ncbi:MAG: shikimate dehydrogenase family protein [Oscillospiraceae bacterium]|jgi:shikimate dehydrogenase
MKYFALTGHPLGHSVSPQIHARLFALSGREECRYELLDLPPEELTERFRELKALDGFNVTIPHKQAIIPLLDRLDETAERYGAVNTVRRDQETRTGYNTDVIGFLRSIQALDVPLKGSRVLVLGYGGAGRMMALEAAHQGARTVTVAARQKSLTGAGALAEEAAARYPGCKTVCADLASVQGRYDLICNSTPVGMYPHSENSPLPDGACCGSTALFDAIYNPGETLLMRQAGRAGLRVAGGMAMLVWQAAAAHEIWYGAQFAPEAIQALIQEMEALIAAEFQPK